jgi:PleD family two-component response regulator
MQYRLRGAHDQLAGALARIESLARSDELTGVANRRGVMERLQQAQQAVERQGTPLCGAAGHRPLQADQRPLRPRRW